MNSWELAECVQTTIDACTGRIMTSGHEQYSEKYGQKFERTPLHDLVQYAREEVQDEINYAVMRDIRLARLQAALEEGFEAYEAEYFGKENGTSPKHAADGTGRA